MALSLHSLLSVTGSSGGSSSKETACNAEDLDSVPGWGRSPTEGMATHSSVLTWKIPWTEEPVGYSTWGLQRVEHN